MRDRGAWLALAVACAACNSRVEASAPPASDAGPPTDATATDSAPQNTDGGGGELFGGVAALSGYSAARSGQTDFQLGADFGNGPLQDSTCQAGTMIGSCCVSQLTPAGSSPWSVAGDITFTGPGGRVLGTLSPAETGTCNGYPGLFSLYDMNVGWAAGDKLDVSASGSPSGVAMFAGTIQTGSLIANPMAGGNPLGMTPVAVNASTDLLVTWSPDATASGDVMSITLTDDPLMRSVLCSTMDGVGMATIPAALMNGFLSGDTGAIRLRRTNTSTPTVPAVNATIMLRWATMIIGAVTY